LNGAAPAASATAAATNSSGQIVVATYQGNGAKVQLSTGATTLNDCVKFDANGNTVDAGAACGSGGGGSGGGIVVYSGSTVAYAGTMYFAVGGGAAVSATEANVQAASPSAATISNLQVQLSAALGVGNSAVFTWRDSGASQPLTCTISGASATSCSDTTHSFNVASGDLIDIQSVVTGTVVVTPTTVISTALGTSGVGVTSVFGNPGPAVGATGDIGATGNVLGVNGVSLCTGFTPTTGQNLQYTTASSPNPCYTAANLPTPSVSTLGGVNSKDCSSGSQLVQKINTDGSVTCAAGGGGGSTVSVAQPYLTVNGSTYGPIWAFTQPPKTGWTWNNQSIVTIDSTFGDLYFNWTATGADALSAYVRTLPSLPVTVVASVRFSPATLSSGQCAFGIDLSDGTKHLQFALFDFEGQGTDSKMEILEWTNTSSPGSVYSGGAALASGISMFNNVLTLKLVVDSTNNTWSYSNDGGNHYIQFAQGPRTAYLTPTAIGVSAYTHTACSASLLSWTGA
jgi:hypothetical protein